MVEEILIELIKGIARLFLHPAVYITLLFSVLLGYVRVKRERKQFRTRILWGWTETKRLLLDGFVWAILLSVISIGVGLVVPTSWLIVYSFCMVLFIYYSCIRLVPQYMQLQWERQFYISCMCTVGHLTYFRGMCLDLI